MNQKITGTEIRGAIRHHELRRELATNQFNVSLVRFEGDHSSKGTPDQAASKLVASGMSLVKLHALKLRLDLSTKVKAPSLTGEETVEVTLYEAKQMLNVAKNLASLWKKVSNVQSRNSKTPFKARSFRATNGVQVAAWNRFEMSVSMRDCETRVLKISDYITVLQALIEKAEGQSIDAPEDLIEEFVETRTNGTFMAREQRESRGILSASPVTEEDEIERGQQRRSPSVI